MEIERSLRNREYLLLDLLYEEAEYITDSRNSFLHNIWHLAKRKFITYDEIKQNTPELFFEKGEAEKISAVLSLLDVHLCDKPPTAEERRRLPEPKFRRIPAVRGIYYGPDDGETDFVASFGETRLSKLIPEISRLIADRIRYKHSEDRKLKLHNHKLLRTGQQKRDLFKERLDSIRAEILEIEQSAEPDRESLCSTPWLHDSDRFDLIKKRKVEHKKLDSLWELASGYGFITYSVVKELAPERLIKAIQVNQIIKFFTDLGIYVCDELPSDEELKKLPKPHINTDYIKTMLGEPYGVYQYDEWKFFHSFMRREEYYPPTSIKSFLIDILREMDRISSDKEDKDGKR